MTLSLPFVVPGAMLPIAHHKSRLNPNAICDNTTSQGDRPETAAAAVVIAARLLDRGHSLDIGIMQADNAGLSQ